MINSLVSAIEISNRKSWDDLLATLPDPHALQSWDWGEFKGRWGWEPVRLAWETPDGTPLAAAQILKRRIEKTPWCMLYLPKGPVWDYTDLTLVERVSADLEAYARREKAIFVKIDPDVPIAFGAEDSGVHLLGERVETLLTQRGWQFSSQQIQFKNTVILDLNRPEAAMLAAMKPKWRYNIRLAARKGVAIRRGTEVDLESFYRLYATTSRRDGFLIRPQAYYLDVWRQFPAANRATLLLADIDGEAVAGLILFHFGQTAWYMYGASDDAHRNLMPNHLLQWEAIKTAQSLGCTRYDMWGAPDTFDESDSMWGVYKFKTGFGGVTRQGLGAFDYPVNKFIYAAYVRFLPKLLSAVRKVTGQS